MVDGATRTLAGTLSGPDLEVPGYTLEHLLGVGGMGAVYSARRLVDGERVALKILNPAESELLRQRFEQEGRIGLTLEHPDIVAVFDTGRTPRGIGWIAMEYLDGFELGAAMPDPSFGFEERLQVLVRVARALQHAHDAGVVHRDVKPSNIFLTREGGVRLLDFGIAKLENRRLTQTGVINGTPQYMPPEHILGHGFDQRGDIFSLGVVAYELFAGGPPWLRGDLHAQLMAVCVAPPRPFREVYQETGWLGVHPKIVEELHLVLHRAIDQERARRYGSMSELAEALERVAALALDPEHATETPTSRLPDGWMHRRLDWSRARAARLLSESTTADVAGNSGTKGASTTASLHDHAPEGSMRVWTGLVALFVAALALAVLLMARS